MPGRDGTGPLAGRGQMGGRMRGNHPGLWYTGDCVCLDCKERVTHRLGMPCYAVSCPKCGSRMVRERVG